MRQEHEKEETRALAMSMHHVNDNTDGKRLSLTQQHPFHKGVKVFGHEKGKEAALKELRQQHAQKCFSPMAVAALTAQECERAQQALMHLAEKQDSSIKG